MQIKTSLLSLFLCLIFEWEFKIFLAEEPFLSDTVSHSAQHKSFCFSGSIEGLPDSETLGICIGPYCSLEHSLKIVILNYS